MAGWTLSSAFERGPTCRLRCPLESRLPHSWCLYLPALNSAENRMWSSELFLWVSCSTWGPACYRLSTMTIYPGTLCSCHWHSWLSSASLLCAAGFGGWSNWPCFELVVSFGSWLLVTCQSSTQEWFSSDSWSPISLSSSWLLAGLSAPLLGRWCQPPPSAELRWLRSAWPLDGTGFTPSLPEVAQVFWEALELSILLLALRPCFACTCSSVCWFLLASQSCRAFELLVSVVFHPRAGWGSP